MTTIFTPQIRTAFTRLGQYLLSYDNDLEHLVNAAKHYNAWFTPEQTKKAVRAIGSMLNETDIDTWLGNEEAEFGKRDDKALRSEQKTVGLVLAGNIPLVGFHDILCVLAAGHTALIKLSSQDKHLTPHILSKLVEMEPSFGRQIRYTERLENFDAVIATGSNNTSRYFEYYFKNVPHIIRKNRNSVAILTGDESAEELRCLGNDIFDYYGLGCRNVSKLYVPQGYDFTFFFEAIESFKEVINHHKYNNNYDYNKSIFLVNLEHHLDNGFLLLKKAPDSLSSPLATLYYDEYQDLASLEKTIESKTDEIQCITGNVDLKLPVQQVGFGCSQNPRLWDYADNINTIQFLLTL